MRGQWAALVGALLLGIAFVPVAAQAAPGDLDKSFGTNGLVVTDLSGPLYAEDYAGDVVTDSSGRIVVAGHTERNGQTESDAIVLRYTPLGSLDPTFGGGDGIVRLHFGAHSFDELGPIAIDANGRIVVAGSTGSDISCTTYCDPVIARLTSSGQLDSTFSGDGMLTITGSERRASSVAIDGSGRILVACGLAVYRLTDTGALDPTFGNSGRAPHEEAYYDLTVDSAGRILVASDYGVRRLLGDGQEDSSFGMWGDGSISVDLAPGSADFVYAVAVDASDRVIAGGVSFQPGSPVNNQPFIVRYTPGGMLDESFGGGDGVVLGSKEGLITDLLVDSAGRYLATGYSNELYTEGGVVIRYLSDGSLDPAFGGGSGFAPVVFNTGDLAIDPSQRIVVVGTGPEDVDIAVSRYFGDVTPDSEPPIPGPSLPVTLPAPTATPPLPARSRQRMHCKRGFTKKRVHGKVRCVKHSKKRRNAHRR